MNPGEGELDDSPATATSGLPYEESSTEPITIKDVLRAIFLPPRDEVRTFPHVAMAQVLEAASLSPEVVKAPPEDLTTPGVIQYENSPIVSAPGPSPTRIASVGIGMIVAILIAYLAQSAVRQEGGIGAGLLYALSGLLWLGLLMFE